MEVEHVVVPRPVRLTLTEEEAQMLHRIVMNVYAGGDPLGTFACKLDGALNNACIGYWEAEPYICEQPMKFKRSRTDIKG